MNPKEIEYLNWIAEQGLPDNDNNWFDFHSSSERAEERKRNKCGDSEEYYQDNYSYSGTPYPPVPTPNVEAEKLQMKVALLQLQLRESESLFAIFRDSNTELLQEILQFRTLNEALNFQAGTLVNLIALSLGQQLSTELLTALLAKDNGQALKELTQRVIEWATPLREGRPFGSSGQIAASSGEYKCERRIQLED